jgi:hypothetical protein
MLRWRELLCDINPLNAELNLICHLLALVAHLIHHISKIGVKERSKSFKYDFCTMAFVHCVTNIIVPSKNFSKFVRESKAA